MHAEVVSTVFEALGALIRARGEVTPEWQEDGTYTEYTARLLGYRARFYRNHQLVSVYGKDCESNPSPEQLVEALAWLTLQTHWQR